MEKKILTIENAVEIIDQVLDRAENKFHGKYGRYPNLLNEKDYILLADFLNINKDAEKSRLGFSHRDEFGYRLMLKTLQREDFFKELGKYQENAFNGIAGRVMYTHSKKEAEFRNKHLQKLIDSEIQVPNGWDNYVNAVNQIQLACFVGQQVSNPKELEEVTKESARRAINRVGSNIVNPSAHYWLSITDDGNPDFKVSWEALQKIWNETFRYSPEYFGDKKNQQYW